VTANLLALPNQYHAFKQLKEEWKRVGTRERKHTSDLWLLLCLEGKDVPRLEARGASGLVAGDILQAVGPCVWEAGLKLNVRKGTFFSALRSLYFLPAL
jgi:hypothetical protein